MIKLKPKILIEIRGGLVSCISTNHSEDEIDLYVVDWDNINNGDEISTSSYVIDNPRTDIDHMLNKWRTQNQQMKLFA